MGSDGLRDTECRGYFLTDVFRRLLLRRVDRLEKFFTHQTLASPPLMRERASEG
jgi:hypothetical protein